MNLAMVHLMQQGQRLFVEIWTDQVPLLPSMLRGWLNLTSWTVPAARLMVLLCSGALIASFYLLVRLSGGHVAALVGTGLLAGSHWYMSLSVSVMQAMPAALFMTASVLAICLYLRSGRWLWALVSGLLMGVALGIKLIALPVLLVTCVTLVVKGAWLRHSGTPLRSAGWPVICHVGPVVLVTLAILTVYGLWDNGYALLIRQNFVQPDLVAQVIAQDYAFSKMLYQDWPIAILAVIGVSFAVVQRDCISIVAVLWLAIALASCAVRQPLWYHHYLLVSVPLCWLAGLAIGNMLERVRQFRGALTGARLARGLAAMAILMMAGQLFAGVRRARDTVAYQQSGEARDQHFVNLLASIGTGVGPVATDQPMVAFRAGQMVYGKYAVTAVKRRMTGEVTDATILADVDRWRPGVIALCRGGFYPDVPVVRSHCQSDYIALYDDQQAGLFLVHRKFAGRVPEWLEAAMALNPDDWRAHLQFGTRLRAAREFDRAREAFQAGIDRATGEHARASLLHELGSTALAQGRLEEAATSWAQSLEHAASVQTYKNLADVLARLGRPDEIVRYQNLVRAEFGNLIDKIPQAPPPDTQRMQQEFDRAMQNMVRSGRIEIAVQGYARAAGSALEQGREADARIWLERATELCMGAATAALARHQVDAAIRWFDEALDALALGPDEDASESMRSKAASILAENGVQLGASDKACEAAKCFRAAIKYGELTESIEAMLAGAEQRCAETSNHSNSGYSGTQDPSASREESHEQGE